MSIQTVSTKGAIVIPINLRRKYNIKPSSKVEIIDTDEGIIILPVLENPIEQLHGFLKNEESLSKLLLENKKIDVEKEDQNWKFSS